jgi:signal peptidase
MHKALRYVPLAFGIILVAGWLVFLRPVTLGGPATYTVVSGDSMDPTLHENDFIVLRAQDEYRVGDVVTYRIPDGDPGAGHVIVHRLIAGDGERGFVTQGDNNPEPDPWRPRTEDILGTLEVQVGGVGAWLMYLRSPLVVGMLAGGLAAYFVLGGQPRRGTHQAVNAPA